MQILGSNVNCQTSPEKIEQLEGASDVGLCQLYVKFGKQTDPAMRGRLPVETRLGFSSFQVAGTGEMARSWTPPENQRKCNDKANAGSNNERQQCRKPMRQGGFDRRS